MLPTLLVNYFGQGALLLANPETRVNPFFHLAPAWGLYPLVVLSTMATVIASQAIISGAFSMTQQAIQLGYSPRFDIQHTSAHEMGQVYIPEINWMLMIATLGLVFGFRSSTNLAAAYGMAVTLTMIITTLLAFVVARELWRWSLWRAGLITAAFLVARPGVLRRERAEDPARRLVPARRRGAGLRRDVDLEARTRAGRRAAARDRGLARDVLQAAGARRRRCACPAPRCS